MLNGIVENYRELKAELEAAGHVFSSETDAEVVAHLLETAYQGDLVEAVRAVFKRLVGPLHVRRHPPRRAERLVGVRHQTPLVVGLGDGENFVASNVAAFLAETRRVQYPDDGDDRRGDARGRPLSCAPPTASPVELEVHEIDWDEEVAERAGYETFMLKEIYEQPEGFAETIGDRVRHGAPRAGRPRDERGRAARAAPDRDRRLRHRLPRRRRRPVRDRGVGPRPGRAGHRERVDLPPPVIDKDTLVIGISQSGETRDTIQAMQLARKLGARTVAITNQMGSQITREVDSVLYTRTGLEVGVAASKTFSAQVGLMYLIGLELARTRETLPPDEIEFILDEVYRLPEKMRQFLRRQTTRSTRSRSASTRSRSSSSSAATSACRSRSRAR